MCSYIQYIPNVGRFFQFFRFHVCRVPMLCVAAINHWTSRRPPSVGLWTLAGNMPGIVKHTKDIIIDISSTMQSVLKLVSGIIIHRLSIGATYSIDNFFATKNIKKHHNCHHQQNLIRTRGRRMVLKHQPTILNHDTA